MRAYWRVVTLRVTLASVTCVRVRVHVRARPHEGDVTAIQRCILLTQMIARDLSPVTLTRIFTARKDLDRRTLILFNIPDIVLCYTIPKFAFLYFFASKYLANSCIFFCLVSINHFISYHMMYFNFSYSNRIVMRTIIRF